MFDIAFSELVVIGLVVLVVLGPKRLPELARGAGRWAGRIRRFVDDVKRDMDVELRKDDLAELRKVKDQLLETKQMFEQTASSTLAAVPDIRPPELAFDEPKSAGLSDSGAATKIVSDAPKTKRAVRKPARTTTRKKSTTTGSRHGRTARKPR